MMLLGRLPPARLPASNATANMLSDSGAIESPEPIAVYSSTIWRKIGRAIINPPSEICCIICPEIPSRKTLEANKPASIRAGFPSRLRRTSHQISSAIATPPTTRSAPTASPPSCHTRMLSTMPPIAKTEKIAPTTSTRRSPVYGASRTSLIWDNTIAMITTSSAKPTRHDRYVVMKPPIKGPTAAAIAAEAPTSA